jgi:hypothetical protein
VSKVWRFFADRGFLVYKHCSIIACASASRLQRLECIGAKFPVHIFATSTHAFASAQLYSTMLCDGTGQGDVAFDDGYAARNVHA